MWMKAGETRTVRYTSSYRKAFVYTHSGYQLLYITASGFEI